MRYRTQSMLAYGTNDGERALKGMRAIVHYLRARHPDVEVSCFLDRGGKQLRFHLFQDAGTEEALLRVRGTTTSDPAFLEMISALADGIAEASSQPYPFGEFEP